MINRFLKNIMMKTLNKILKISPFFFITLSIITIIKIRFYPENLLALLQILIFVLIINIITYTAYFIIITPVLLCIANIFSKYAFLIISFILSIYFPTMDYYLFFNHSDFYGRNIELEPIEFIKIVLINLISFFIANFIGTQGDKLWKFLK